MIDYGFYVNTYLGSAIPEKAFSGVASQAQVALAGLKRRYTVLIPDGISEKMALCAMADAIHAHAGRRNGVTSATVGGVSVRYSDTAVGDLQKQVLNAARIYLDIYRGVC